MFIEEDSDFILGRGHESDVRISDISVSRSHARIYFKDKKFMLEDTGSKFGTLVLSKDDIEINNSNKILQIGRTLLNASEMKLNLHSKLPTKKESVGLVSEKAKVGGKYSECKYFTL